MGDAEIGAVFFDIGDTLVRDSNSWVPGAKDAVRRLHALDLRLGLISNTAGLNREQLVSHLPSDFDFGSFHNDLILLSSEVGLEKPDIRIFTEAIKRAAIPPWACIFVGERLDETFSAQRAGMRAVRIVHVPDDFAEIQSWLT